MTVDLEERKQGWRFSPTGIVFTRALDDAEYTECGRKAVAIANGSTWALGDWVAYGLGRGPKGDTYTVAQKLTGRTYDGLVQLMKVAEAFPQAKRTHRVPWSHYREALRLDPGEREAFLARSEAEGWTRDRLSQAIEDHRAPRLGRPARQVRGGGPSVRERREAERRGEDYGRRSQDRLKGPKSPGPRENVGMCCPNCGHRWTARLLKGKEDDATPV